MMAEKEEFLVEFTVIGNAVKVTAIDPITLTEVSMVGDIKLTQRELAKLAARKLRYMLAKQSKK